MCPKGNAGLMTLYDPDRLKTPLKRTNPQKGRDQDPQWKAISWDEAFNEIAGKLKALRDAGEAHKLIWFSEDHSFTHIQQDFCALYGTPNYHNHSNLCDVARKASFKLVLGDERPLMDALQSKYIMLFGWNPLSATKWAHLPRIITRALERGARLVVVDPVYNATAAKASEWVPIKPSTDGALALALGHVIIRDKLHDERFINEWAVGFDEYAAYVKDKTPEWAEKITGVSAKTIERLARELATTKPAVVDVWSGPGQQSNGVQGGRAIALLNVLTGNVDGPGTIMIPERTGNSHQKVKAPKIDQPRLDGHGKKYPFSHGSGIYTETLTRIAKGDAPYMPKIGVVVFQNMAMSIPGSKDVEEALKKLEYLVVVDTHMSETALLANIALPGTTYFERYDYTTNWVTWTALALRQPVVKPLFGQPAEYETVVELGRRIDLKDTEGKDFFWQGPKSKTRVEDRTRWYEEFLSLEIENGGPRITLDELKALPGAVWLDPKGTRYEKFKDEVKVPEGGTVDEKAGVVKDRGGAVVGVKVGTVAYKGFNTPSRKLEFYSTLAASKKDANGNLVDGLPLYVPRDWQPDDNYPLYFVSWKESPHTHTRTFNNPFLMELAGWNPLLINPRTAHRLGINDGDEIWVESPFGKAKTRARVTEGIQPDTVGFARGFGHWALGKLARGKGAHDNQLLPMKSDPISGMALNKEACVRVYKA
ncbi:MAG: molybdopterin-dependent oxidoreductase [Chloroflexi bacterium]|nr:molybdopterin-dependent oxidoreductase [Chloroflexota bacterium]